MPTDVAYAESRYRAPEIAHAYGPRVHLLDDPLASTLRARACAPETAQPEVGRLVRTLYDALARVVVQLLRHRTVAPRALQAVVGAVVVSRVLDLWVALHPPSPLSAIPGLDGIPGFVPAFTLPLLALATWLVVRVARPAAS
jgi:hypothetical protein